ncbi:unnamed protein product [Amoebophrya sp. A120]|nr:unnamed protein product [Amoebophrya sp. A120]|eukprot:GSA120T00000737001.1
MLFQWKRDLVTGMETLWRAIFAKMNVALTSDGLIFNKLLSSLAAKTARRHDEPREFALATAGVPADVGASSTGSSSNSDVLSRTYNSTSDGVLGLFRNKSGADGTCKNDDVIRSTSNVVAPANGQLVEVPKFASAKGSEVPKEKVSSATPIIEDATTSIAGPELTVRDFFQERFGAGVARNLLDAVVHAQYGVKEGRAAAATTSTNHAGASPSNSIHISPRHCFPRIYANSRFYSRYLGSVLLGGFWSLFHPNRSWLCLSACDPLLLQVLHTKGRCYSFVGGLEFLAKTLEWRIATRAIGESSLRASSYHHERILSRLAAPHGVPRPSSTGQKENEETAACSSSAQAVGRELQTTQREQRQTTTTPTTIRQDESRLIDSTSAPPGQESTDITDILRICTSTPEQVDHDHYDALSSVRRTKFAVAYRNDALDGDYLARLKQDLKFSDHTQAQQETRRKSDVVSQSCSRARTSARDASLQLEDSCRISNGNAHQSSVESEDDAAHRQRQCPQEHFVKLRGDRRLEQDNVKDREASSGPEDHGTNTTPSSSWTEIRDVDCLVSALPAQETAKLLLAMEPERSCRPDVDNIQRNETQQAPGDDADLRPTPVALKALRELGASLRDLQTVACSVVSLLWTEKLKPKLLKGGGYYAASSSTVSSATFHSRLFPPLRRTTVTVTMGDVVGRAVDGRGSEQGNVNTNTAGRTAGIGDVIQFFVPETIPGTRHENEATAARGPTLYNGGNSTTKIAGPHNTKLADHEYACGIGAEEAQQFLKIPHPADHSTSTAHKYAFPVYEAETHTKLLRQAVRCGAAANFHVVGRSYHGVSPAEEVVAARKLVDRISGRFGNSV